MLCSLHYTVLYIHYTSVTCKGQKDTRGMESECSVGRVSVGEDDKVLELGGSD